MKELYEKPELEIIKLNSQVLTDIKSGSFDLDDEDDLM